MRRSMKIAAAVTLGCSSLVFAMSIVQAQRVKPARQALAGAALPKPKAVPKHAVRGGAVAAQPPVMAAAADTPFWNVTVLWSLNLDGPTQALYQQMANLLSGVNAVPNDRLNYYSAVNDPPTWVIQSWSGMVSNVVANPDGSYQVTVTANPLFAGQSSLSLLSDYSEIYNIDQDNNINYVGFSDPNNWAGTIPGLANM